MTSENECKVPENREILEKAKGVGTYINYMKQRIPVTLHLYLYAF